MPPSAEELEQARAALKENREFDVTRKVPLAFSSFALFPLTFRAFDDWHKGHTTSLYLLGAFVCILWPVVLYRRARRQRYLQSRYASNAALLEKWKDDPMLFPPKRALLWRLDAFLSGKRMA